MQINPERERSNKGNFLAELTSYTAANPYITPCDGYVYNMCVSANDIVHIVVNAANDVNVAALYYATAFPYEAHALFVPKGMKVYAESSASSSVGFIGIDC